ncbi:hypothetical protein ACJX0J_005449, partial [Zea mays]
WSFSCLTIMQLIIGQHIQNTNNDNKLLCLIHDDIVAYLRRQMKRAKVDRSSHGTQSLSHEDYMPRRSL